MKKPHVLLVICFLCFGETAYGHDSRPLFVELLEAGQGQYTLRWRTPATVKGNNLPTIVPPESCDVIKRNSGHRLADAVVESMQLSCKKPFGQEGFHIEFPAGNPSLSSLIRFHPLDGELVTEILPPGEDQWLPPESGSLVGIASSYVRLGISHILKGLDHLLFVLCLVWVAGSWRRIALTVTGFTLAHSLTLVLASLNIVRVPAPPLEASIALSIVFLSIELVKGRRNSVTWRHPIAVSSSFGLLHGFGFATVLQDVGLPTTDLAVGLLFFNVGVEIGQLLAIGLVLFFVSSVRAITADVVWRFDTDRALQRVTGYSIGVVSTMWLIQRVTTFVA